MNHPTTPGQPQDPSTTLGVGGATSGQEGATPIHETQQETGGSGGDGLTRNQSGETANAPTGTAPGGAPHVEAEDSAMTHTARGPQDTRPNQAGAPSVGGTGLGTPETGANQDPGDLPPRG